jgi:hypothetical protein
VDVQDRRLMSVQVMVNGHAILEGIIQPDVDTPRDPQTPVGKCSLIVSHVSSRELL